MAKIAKRIDPIRPGEILFEEFMRPHGISQNRLARDIDVNPARVNDIVHGRSSITAAVALKLAKYFRTTPELWLNLQADYDLRLAEAKDRPSLRVRGRN
jgi:addiction module HigA family antidote